MLLSSSEECGQTYSRQAIVGPYVRYKEEGEEYRGNSGTTYVTKTILSSFQPFIPTFSSHKASHPRTPCVRDLITENPASSKSFPGLPLFPPYVDYLLYHWIPQTVG
jgi:hypothetical protein